MPRPSEGDLVKRTGSIIDTILNQKKMNSRGVAATASDPLPLPFLPLPSKQGQGSMSLLQADAAVAAV